MRFAAPFLLLPLAFCAALLAQDQEAQPPAPPPPPLLENHGRPMKLPFRCTTEDIRAAGLSCSEEEPCAIFLELSAAAHVDDRIVITGNLHAESVTLASVLLESDDAGRTWNEGHPRIRGATIDRIQFLDSGFGWISGEEQVPLPQNPFLLITEDHGKTWTQEPVLREAAENPFGTVQQFYFSSQTTGSLILDRGQGSGQDRYALFSSENGGHSWDIKQESSRPLRLPQTAPAPVWRVRVDAASRSYRVERLQGERWNSIAAFAVNLDPCKPPPVEPPPPDK